MWLCLCFRSQRPAEGLRARDIRIARTIGVIFLVFMVCCTPVSLAHFMGSKVQSLPTLYFLCPVPMVASLLSLSFFFFWIMYTIHYTHIFIVVYNVFIYVYKMITNLFICHYVVIYLCGPTGVVVGKPWSAPAAASTVLGPVLHQHPHLCLHEQPVPGCLHQLHLAVVARLQGGQWG